MFSLNSELLFSCFRGMCVDLWAVTPGAACVTAGASSGSDKARGKLGAAVARMSLKSLILGRVAGENKIYLFVCGNCTAPSVTLLQTSLKDCPHPQSVWKVGSPWPSATAECSVFVMLCTRRNEGYSAFPGAQLHSPNERCVPLDCRSVLC